MSDQAPIGDPVDLTPPTTVTAADDPVQTATPPPAPPAPVKPKLEGPSFNFRRVEDEDDPTIPFAFQGEQFHIHPKRINGMVAMDLTMLDASSGPMWEFFEGVLGEDYRRFRRIVRDPKLIIDISEIKRLFDWITEQTANLPT